MKNPPTQKPAGLGRASERLHNDDSAKISRYPLTVNLDEARVHLRLLDPNSASFIFASFDDDKERAKLGQEPHPWQRRARLEQIAPALTRRQALGCGLFVCISEMRGERRRNGDVSRIRAVFVEDDTPRLDPRADWLLEPSIIVESSLSRFHYYWLTCPDNLISPAEFDKIQGTLVARHGGDKSARDKARVLRLAGTWNLKPARDPFQVRLIHEAGWQYGRADLLRAFPPLLEKRRLVAHARHLPASGGDKIERVRQALRELSAENYDTWYRVGAALRKDLGEDGRALWDEWSAASSKFNPQAQDAKWREVASIRNIGLGSVFYWAREFGCAA